MKNNGILLSVLTLFLCCNLSFENTKNTENETVPQVDISRTKTKAAETLKYCKANKLNTDFCILIDMSLHSGTKRFLVWDFNKDTLENAFLVSHGCCQNPWSGDFSKENPDFSNQDGSHCSSLGKYKIGIRAYSDWGIRIKYLLHGLESTNNNALGRAIVFHSWEEVSDTVVYPKGTPEGWGCPSISNNSMKLMDTKLSKVSVPVLMWIYQ